MSRKRQIKMINELERLRTQILKEILYSKKMLPGSFHKVHCRCGKKNCWCYGKDKDGHPAKRLTWSEKGVKKTKAIPDKDVDWIKKVTENYRNFRKKRKEIQKLEDNIRSLIDDYRKDIVKETRKLKQYL